jgi:protein SCO1
MGNRKKIVIALGAVLWACVGVVAFSAWRLAEARPPAFHGTTYEELAPAAEFSLTDHRGRPATLASFRGRPVLLFFGYTHCPDVCPLTLTKLNGVLNDLGSRAEDVRIVLVTVDPARDTPAVLADYVRRFGPRVTGLTGDSAAVARAMAGYGAYVLPPEITKAVGGHEARGPSASGDSGESHASAESHGASSDASNASKSADAESTSHAAHAPAKAAPVVGHSGVIYGIDRDGNLRVVISEGAPREQVAADVRTLAGL